MDLLSPFALQYFLWLLGAQQKLLATRKCRKFQFGTDHRPCGKLSAERGAPLRIAVGEIESS